MKAFAQHLTRVWTDRSGGAAIEFALVLPAFLMLVVGGLFTAQLLFVESSLQYAVEEGARCASIKTTVCSDSASTLSYVQSHFDAAGSATPTFTSTTAACGHSVVGTVTFALDTGLTKIDVPLSASACFP